MLKKGLRVNTSEVLNSDMYYSNDSCIKVLLLDDQPRNVTEFEALLGPEPDIQLVHIYNPMNLFPEVLRLKPSILLMHLSMPGTDVPELIRKFRGVPATSEIPIIVFSDTSDSAVRAEAFYAGATDFISCKPNRVELITKIRHHALQYLKQAQTLEALRELRSRQFRLEQVTLALEQLSYQDPLTSIANRRRFNEIFQIEWRRHRRIARPLAIIMLDIDWFKSYNDYYGHQKGDECIRLVAKTIKESAKRAGDLVARYGGEEFIVLLPDTELDGAFVVANRILKHIRILAIDHKSNKKKGIVTLSAGVSAVVPSMDTDPESLIQLADDALYQAKKMGRDQVCKMAANSTPRFNRNRHLTSLKRLI